MDYVGKTIIDNIDDMTNIIKTQLNDIAEGFVSVAILVEYETAQSRKPGIYYGYLAF